MQDLTGVWNCADTLTYYFTQYGDKLFGHGTNEFYKNVVVGTIDSKNKTLSVDWIDTPDSDGMGNKGNALLDISIKDKMVKKSGSPGLGVFERFSD